MAGEEKTRHALDCGSVSYCLQLTPMPLRSQNAIPERRQMALPPRHKGTKLVKTVYSVAAHLVSLCLGGDGSGVYYLWAEDHTQI